MRKPVSLLSLFSITLLALLLSGCSGEPSSDDIKAAMQDKIDQHEETTKKFMGDDIAKSLKTEIHSVKKIKCKEAEENNGYICDIEFDATYPVIGRQTKTDTARFVEGDDGWVVMD